MCVYMYVRMYVCMYVCTYACMHMIANIFLSIPASPSRHQVVLRTGSAFGDAVLMLESFLLPGQDLSSCRANAVGQMLAAGLDGV